MGRTGLKSAGKSAGQGLSVRAIGWAARLLSEAGGHANKGELGLRGWATIGMLFSWNKKTEIYQQTLGVIKQWRGQGLRSAVGTRRQLCHFEPVQDAIAKLLQIDSAHVFLVQLES